MAEMNSFPVAEHTREGATNSQLHFGNTSNSPGVTYTQSGAAIARDATVSKSCDEIRNETVVSITKAFDSVKQMYEHRLDKLTDTIKQLEEKNQQLEEGKQQYEKDILLLKQTNTQKDVQASMEKTDTQKKADDNIHKLEVEVSNEKESRDRLQRYIMDLSVELDGLTSEFKQHTRDIDHKVHIMNDGDTAGADTPNDIDRAVRSIMGNLECLQAKLIELKTFKKTNYNTVLELNVRKGNLEKMIKESSKEINSLTTEKSEWENKYKEVEEKCKLLQRRIDEYKAGSKSTAGPSSVSKTTPLFRKTPGQVKPDVEEQPRTRTSSREDSYSNSSAYKISHSTYSPAVNSKRSHSTEQGKSLTANTERVETSSNQSTSVVNSSSSRNPETKMKPGVTGNAFEKSAQNIKPSTLKQTTQKRQTNGTTRGVSSAEECEIKQSQNANGSGKVSRERIQPLQIGTADTSQSTQHTGNLHTGTIMATCTVQTMAYGRVIPKTNPPNILGKSIEVAKVETLQTEINSEKFPLITKGTVNGNQHTQE